jgi:hypothetical protein
MDSSDRTALDYFHERAAQCRRLARQAVSNGIAVELENLARDYDRDAAELQTCPRSVEDIAAY